MSASLEGSKVKVGDTPSERSLSPEPGRDRYTILLLLGFSLLLYAVTTGYDLVGDDEVLLGNNPYVQSFHYLPEIFTGNFWSFLGARKQSTYYRPLVMLSLLVQRAAFGPWPGTFHLVNVLINALVVLLVYRLGKRLWPQGQLALWAGLLFAALPVHTEAVEPVSGISDLECAVFFVLAALVYTRPLDGRGRMSRITAWLAAGMFLLSALCKEVGLVLPVLLVFYEHFIRADGKTPGNERFTRYAPTLLLFVLYMVFRFSVVGSFREVVAGQNPEWKKIITFGLCQLGNYVYKLLWPAKLTYDWEFRAPANWWDPSVLFGGLVVLVSAVAIIRNWREQRAVAFAFAWFFLTLAPVLNLGGIGVTAYGERYLYLPSAGFCWLVGEGVRALVGAGNTANTGRWKFAQGFLVVLLVLATGRTVARLPAWRNDFTLTTATLRDDPNAAAHHLILGNFYRRHGERGLARIEYVQAIALDASMATAYVNMAGVLWDDGKPGAARDFLQRARQVNPFMPEAFYESGRVELWLRNRQQAFELFQQAVALNANYFDALYMVGSMFLEDGKLDEAERFLTRAVRVNPGAVDAHLGLGAALARRGEPVRAEREFRVAMELAPASDLPYLSLAGLYEAEKRLPEALELYRRAVRAQPNSGNAQFRLGVLALKMGNVQEAIQALESAVAIQPNAAVVHTQLGLAYLSAGNRAGARRELETAMRLKPDDETARAALQKLE